MKNILKKSMVLFLALGVMLTACKGKESKKALENKEEKKLKVVTTIFPEYDLTRAVAKDKVDLKMIIKPGVDVHSFSPSPQDIKEIESSDVFIYGGTEHDKWVEPLTKNIDFKNKKVVKLLDCVKQLEEETVEGMKDEDEDHDHEKEHEHEQNHEDKKGDEKENKDKKDEHNDEDEKEIDPHYWTSVKNAILMVKNIEKNLSQKDPKNEKFYKENAKNYIEKLEKVDKDLHDVVDNAKRKKIVIADRFPFRYLFDDLHLEYRALFSGCSVESNASAAQVKQMEDYIKENNIPVVYHIEMGKGDMAKAIAKDMNIKVMVLNSIHTVTKDEFDKGITYVDLMQQNVKALREGLN